MPLSTDVNLPKSHRARFPDACVVCGRPSPSSTVRLITGSIGWWSWLLWMFRKPFSVRAPACAHCAWRLHLQRLASVLTTIGLIFIAIWWIWPAVEDHVPHWARKLAMLGLALSCWLPQGLYEVLYPHAFSITAFPNSVDYEFRDVGLALEFVDLNGDAAWVKVK